MARLLRSPGTGSTTDGQTLTDTIYYQGMNGDTLPGGGTRTASVALSPDVTVPGATASDTDTAELAGSPREVLTYKGSGGSVASASVSSYWVSAPTATRNRTGLPALTATMVRPTSSITTTAITSGPSTTWRTTQATKSYDKTTGLVRFVDDRGDIADPKQETCTTTNYAPINDTWNLIGLPTDVEADAGACGTGDTTTSDGMAYPAGVNRPTDVLSDARTYYDTAAPTSWPPVLPSSQSAPSIGQATIVAQANSYSGGSFTYQPKAATSYDAYGRAVATWDALGNKTATAYTTAGGQTTQVALTNAKGQKTTSTVDPARGLTTAVVDPNTAETDTTYDALGRSVAIWLPGRAKATQSANYTFAYQPSATAPSAVTTNKLNEDGSYSTSVQLFDALLRPRQTQAQTPRGGRMLSDSYYDSRGWTYKTNHVYWDGSSTPNTTLVATTDQQVTNQDLVTFDGLGRPVLSVSQYKGVVREQSKTIYGGDRTTVIPPTGGTPTTTITDGRGRTTETDKYTEMPTVVGDQVAGGSPALTKFSFDVSGSHGQVASITDPGGNQRTYSYNLLGQKTSQTDPDTGTTAMSYDAAGHLTSTTDARGKTVSLTYDVLGRKTTEYDGADSSAPKLASWTYDDPAVINSIGRQTASSHYDSSGNAYTTATTGFQINGNPTGSTVTIPSNVTGLAGTYTYKYGYTPNVGLPLSTSYPLAGSLPAEKVFTGYNVFDLPTSVGGLATYAADVTYDAYARVSQLSVGTLSNIAAFTNTYDEHTGALVNANTTRYTAPQTVEDTTYTRDPAGNITRITNNRLGAASDTQCYGYNLLGRMTDAWTATDNCTGTPSTSGASPTVGGPDPYWTTWTFDTDGNRTTQVQHALPGATGDTTTTYTYGQTADPTKQPDTLTATQTTLPDGTKTGSTYAYDTGGNTQTRTTTPGTDTLTWNTEGKLASLKSTGQDNPTTYNYDADGNQLLRTDPNGRTTLFLPGQEVTYDPASKTVSGTRYIPLPGGVTVTRTGASTAYNYAASNHQATGTSSLDSTAQTPTFRLFDPYGNPRGTKPGNWPGDKGFVGGVQDTTTNLTHLGAREYDPTLGRFISADPLFIATDPNQIGGYTYSGDSPVTFSDPSGLHEILSDTGGWEETHGGTNKGCIAGSGNKCGGLKTLGEIRATNEEGTSHKGGGSGGHGDGGPVRQIKIFGQTFVNQGVNYVTGFWHAATNPISNGWDCATEWDCDAFLQDEIQGTGGIQGVQSVLSSVEHGIDIYGDFSEGRYSEGAAKVTFDVAAYLLTRKFGGEEASGCPNSFTAVTAVRMADGSSQPIEHVQIGDQVLATDPVTGTTKPEKVTDVIVTKTDKDFTDLTVHTPSGDRTITSTQHHPYWDATSKQWVNAADLHPGEELRQPDGTLLVVAAVRNYHQAVVTYNLTVGQLHTYYVLAGTTPILVHNCGTFETLQNEHVNGQYLYRGVPEGHPGFPNATEGRAVPRGGNADPVQHNDGSTDSPYTSWTTSPRVARRYAMGVREGEAPGVILRIKLPTPGNPLRQMALFGEDKWGENEVLVQNPVQGATIFDLR